MSIFSFGGGVQSMAALILSIQGKLDYTDFIFSNVGDDSENPKTLSYVRNIAIPYADKYGIKITEIQRERKPNRPQTLYQELLQDAKYITIPVYLNGSGPQLRSCTTNWKILVIDKYVRKNYGATKINRIKIGVGISIDESHRMRTDDAKLSPYTIKTYPLIDLMLTRNMCIEIIQSAGLPIPPKSSCYFCPFKKTREFINMSQEDPELFAKTVELEQVLNKKLSYRNNEHGGGGLHRAYLTSTNKPLIELVSLTHEQGKFAGFDDELYHCEQGFCTT